MEQRIGEAKIVDFECIKCQDTGIQTGTAVMDGEKIVIVRLCPCKNEKNEEE